MEYERLEAFEKVLQSLKDSQADIVQKMDVLREQGKTNSATFRQLMGKKLNNENMLTLFRLYGIE